MPLHLIFLKLILVFALIRPLSREPTDFTKIASPISSAPSLNKNIALKARNAKVVIKSDADGLPIIRAL